MAEEKKKQLFRQKSIESMDSPEAMNDYLRVTSPGIWALLATVIILLIGVCVWGILGHIDTKALAAVVSEDGKAVCYVPEAALDPVIDNKTVSIDGKNYTLKPSILEPQTVSTDMDIYIRMAGDFQDGDIVYPVDVVDELEPGVYSGTIMTESISPVSFILSK